MADYSYLFADLLTNDILGELPLHDVTFGRVLRGAGSFSGKVAIEDERVRRLDPIGVSRPGRTVVYVVRDGALLPGGYLLWTRRYQGGALELEGTEVWSYFAHRLIRSTLSFEQVDQGVIVAEILDLVQSLPSGDIGVGVSSALTGVLRDRTYYGYELKPAGEAIEQLAAVIDGFDFSIDVAGALTNPAKTLVVSYPRRGVQAFETDLLFDLPGNILGYEWPEDATRMADVAIAVGEGEGDDMLLAEATYADAIAAGYPLLEKSLSYKDIRDLEYLQAHADVDVIEAGEPVTIPGLTVRGDVDPIVGSYDTGDDCRMAIVDARFPNGVDQYARIIGYEVTPEDPEDGLETVRLDLGEASE